MHEWAIPHPRLLFFRRDVERRSHPRDFADSQARSEAAVLRTAPLIGLLYSTLVVWFADTTHLDAVAMPPIRPWYPHKRGLAFTDVLRAAQRALISTDVLDRRSYSEDLRNSGPLRSSPELCSRDDDT